MRFRFAPVAVLLFTAAAAHADTVNFTLTNPTQTGAPGSTLTFTGTASAPSSNTGTEFLNGDSFNVSNGASLDDTDLFTNFPASLAPGASYTDAVFTLLLPANAAVGTTFTGSFTLQGGSNPNAYGNFNSQPFTASIAAAPTPEPSSLLLLGTGALSTGFFFRRRSVRASL